MNIVQRVLAAGGTSVCLGLMATFATGAVSASSGGPDANTQIAELLQLQAAYHGVVSGAGVSPEAKAQHLADVLELWTNDGMLAVGGNIYAAKGVPGTPSCEPGSFTLCDFYANQAPPFVLGRDWLSVAPTFKTTISVHGNTADLYFECHFIDVVTREFKGAATFGERGYPGTGQARKVNGVWLFSYAVVVPPPLTSS